MTNAEAIEHLKNITIFSYQGRYIDKARDALDMAIKALEAQELSNNSPKLDSEFGDLISRQAAIDAILAVTGNSSVRELYEHVQEHGLSDMWSGGVSAAIDIIIAVPPAQQEPPTDDTISRQAAIDAVCESCSIEGDYHKCDGYPKGSTWCEEITALRNVPSAQPEPCEDAVSRQAAIDALKNRWKKTRNYEGNGDDIAEECELYLKQVPSAQADIIACGDCKYWICHDRRCGYWNHGVKPLEWCCHAEREANGN